MLTDKEHKAGCRIRHAIQVRGWGLRANSPLVGDGALVQVTLQAADWYNIHAGTQGSVYWWEGRHISAVDDRALLMAQLQEMLGKGPIALYEDIQAAGLREQFARICLQGNIQRAIAYMPPFRPEAKPTKAGQRQGIQNRETEVALGVQQLMSDAMTQWTDEQTQGGTIPQNKAQLVGRPLAAATTRTTVSNPTAQGVQRINRSHGEEPAVDALIAATWQVNVDIRNGKYKKPSELKEGEK